MAYVELLGRIDRGTELRWQAQAFAKAMGAEGELPGLAEMLDDSHESFNAALAAEPEQVSTTERILRSALGLRER